MNEPLISVKSSFDTKPYRVPLIWGGLLLIWLIALCIVHDPRPLGAPEWAVGQICSLTGLSEPASRVVVTFALRGVGMAMIGVLLVLALRRVRNQWAVPFSFVVAPLLAVLTQWINFGHFPITPQLRAGVGCAILGVLAGIVLRRSRMALVALVILIVGLFIWGTSTGIRDDLHEAARITLLHVLENAQDIPKGDDGFAMLLHRAFTFAEDNSHGTEAVLPNRAAILALGVILGEDRVVKVGKRKIDPKRMVEAQTLRRRVTLNGRRDLSQHFWVSAALTILSNEKHSMTVGITKELMDATPGGSGFSFVDLTADRAGILFAVASTRNEESARAMQLRIQKGVRIADFCPDIRNLPEGISRDNFQKEYGGLNGVETQKIVKEIQRRLATCEWLQ
jgi:uncharacterized protein YfiM (DUF2279 family)